MVRHTIVEARATLVGDSLWMYGTLAKLLLDGGEATVVCNEQNQSMYEFFRDYCEGTERLQVTRDSKGQTTTICPGNWPNLNLLLPLRKPLEPIVADGPYLVFQPESSYHQKRKGNLRPIISPIRGYSVGVYGEYVQPNTEAFQSRSIADVARLIYHSVGVVAIFSSMSLFASFLGKKLLCVGYDGTSIGKVPQTGFPAERCRFEEGAPHEIENAILEYLGPFK